MSPSPAVTQDPQPVPPNASEQQQADMLARLVKFRVDQLKRGRPDDMGRVAIPPITDEAEAVQTAQQALRGFIAANSGDHPEAKKSMQALRDYLSGKADMPKEWVLDESPIPSREGLYAQKAAEGRERLAGKPFGAEALAVQDYFVEPIGRLAAGAVQVPVDIGTGILNWAGANIRRVDLRANALAGIRSLIGGEKFDVRRAEGEFGGMAASASGAAQTVGKVADIAGMLRGFKIGGAVGAPVAGTMKVGEAIGRKVAAPVAKAVEKVVGKTAGKAVSGLAGGAGAFGAYEVVSEAARQGERPTGGETLEALEHGAIAGAAMSTAAGVARIALRKLFSEAAGATKVAGEDGQILKAMKDWAKKNNVVPVPNQSVTAYGSKLIDSWVSAGMPGAPPMAARKFIGRALEVGVEAGGFSAIDVNFQHDFMEAIFRQDPEAFARMAKTYGTNFLGIAASRMRVQDIPGFQRQQPTKRAKPVEQEPTPATPEEAKRQEAADAEQARLVKERGEAQQKDLAEEFWRGYERGDPAAIAMMGDQAIGDLLRQGWQFRRPEAAIPAERVGGDVKLETELPPEEARGKPSGTMELPGTGFSFEVREGEVFPSQSMRELLSLPESLPAKEFTERVNKAGIFAALDAGTLLPGTKISAAPPIYADGDVMRTVAIDGTVLESPLGPEPQWTEAKSVPARGGDVIGKPQQQVIDGLEHILNTRTDLPQEAIATLSKIITHLKTVSWQNDQAVADTLAQAQDLLAGIGNGSPEHASRALQAMGEMLTTKSPEVAIDDLMSREQEVQQLTRETRERLRVEREGQQPQQPASEGRAVIRIESPNPEAVEYLRSEGFEPGQEPGTFVRQAPPGREGEAGFLDVGRMARVADIAIRRAVRRLMRMPGRAIGTALGYPTDNRVGRAFSLAAQEKAREELGEKFGNRTLQAETNTREYIDEFSPMVEEIPSGNNRELERMHWQERTPDGVVSGYRTSHIAKETDLRQRFGFDLSSLSERAQQFLEPWNRLTKEIRRRASELRMHVQGLWTPEGELAEIAPEAKKDVMTRQPTAEMVDAMLRGPGNRVRNAIVSAVAHENNMSREEVERIFAEDGWTDARSLKRRDAIEHMRRFKYFPDHIKVPGHGTIKLLETNPLLHAKRMMYGAAMRLGTVKEFGPDDPLPAGEQHWQPADQLPTPYRRIVESFPEPLRDTAANSLRSLMGMQTNPLRRDLEVGSFGHKFWRLLGGLNDTDAASKMTFGSPIRNAVEAWSTGAALLGLGRISRAANDVLYRVANGEWRDLLRERQEAGGFAVHKGEWLLGGEQSGFEQTMRALRTAGEALILPLRTVQTVTDIIVHKALEDAVRDWRDGNRNATDADAIMTMFGFSREHAEQLVNGEAPPQAYRQVLMNGLARLTRSGDLPINKSDFARSRSGFAQAIKFTGYFQTQFAKMRQATINLREAETPRQQATAAANLGKLLGFNMANFMVGSSLVKLASGGWDELMGFWSETIEDVQTPGGAAALGASALIGSMVGSLGTAVSGGLYALFTGDEKDKAEILDTLVSTVPAAGTALNSWDFLNAMGHTLADKPVGEDNVYSGKSPLQQIGYYVGKQIPLARWVESGPFGLGITYLGTDPKLENALKANRRIDDKLGVNEFFGTASRKEVDANEDKVDDRDLFVQTMRAAVTKLKTSEEDVDVADIAQAIRDAMPDQDDQGIAQSFLRRRVLSGANWTKLSEEQQASKLRSLGAERVELLEGFDAVLERAAAFFKPIGRRRRR